MSATTDSVVRNVEATDVGKDYGSDVEIEASAEVEDFEYTAKVKVTLNSRGEVVSVEDNDTLWSLADRYNNGDEDTASYINNIMQMNDLSSDTIHSGKNLVIYYYSTEIR